MPHARRLLTAVLVGAFLLLTVVLARAFLPLGPLGTDSASAPPAREVKPAPVPRQLAAGRHLTVWWDVLPPVLRERTVASEEESNIHPGDYAGPESCRRCHAQNYASWSSHPHRWMNALAGAATVKGDFSGAAVSYRGGRLTFSREDGKFFMSAERGDVSRRYEITQTIGSRFFQYYVGKQVEGPEDREHRFYAEDHVLPFGYWLAQKEWVTVIHIGPEIPDEQRPDPFQPPEGGRYHAVYASSCNYCHTTFALGDMFSRRPQQMGEHAPVPMHWSVGSYLEDVHPDVAASVRGQVGQKNMRNPLFDWEAPRHAVTLGVSCEACHLGGKAHVESEGRIPPKFFPTSPHLAVETAGATWDMGRSHDNVNWACGRCHVGPRPHFAAGMSTWNSVEYSDAMRGSCYSKLRCIDCHNPHRPIGARWSLSGERDDALCLRCHQKLEPAAERQHTHHAAGSEGARCMNCHMPRINEGIEDVVRTHMIYSPTRADMIEANHPNACNLCHTNRPIGWTLDYLGKWYGKRYISERIKAAYPHRDAPVGHGWLESKNPSVRLVAVEAMTRGRDFRSLPRLLDALDDPYLVNRQFATKGLQEMLGVRLSDFGYRLYMTADERRAPLARIRAALTAKREDRARKSR
jgi:predicted CXXCH cytochrome family protein